MVKEPAPAVIGLDTVQKVKMATVHVQVELATGKVVEGSGFFALEPGIVLTNAHVVGRLRASSNPPRKVEVVLNSGQKGEVKLAATLLGVDQVNDLAVLRVQDDEKLWPTPLAVESDLTKLVETQKVYIFGFPLGKNLGKEISVSESSIASFCQTIKMASCFKFRSTAACTRATPEARCRLASGLVIGVAVAGIRGTAINFAVPSAKVHSMLQGRVQAQEMGELYRDGNNTKIPLQVAFLDPLARIRQVTLEYWTGDAGRPARALKQPTPVAGDTQRIAANLDYKQGIAKGDLPLLTLAPGKVQWVQAQYVTKAGLLRWGPATALKIGDAPPLERVPAKLIVNAASQERSLNLTGKFGLQLVKGKDKFVETTVLDLQILESLVKTPMGNKVKLAIANGQFYFVEDGRKKPRHAAAQANVRATIFDYSTDLGGRLTGFGFVTFNSMNAQQREEANDMAADVATTYQAASLGMPNREVAPRKVGRRKSACWWAKGPRKTYSIWSSIAPTKAAGP